MLVECPNCGWEKEAREAHAGMKARCPKCLQHFEVPNLNSAMLSEAKPPRYRGAECLFHVGRACMWLWFLGGVVAFFAGIVVIDQASNAYNEIAQGAMRTKGWILLGLAVGAVFQGLMIWGLVDMLEINHDGRRELWHIRKAIEDTKGNK